jgi:hypothetical protein
VKSPGARDWGGAGAGGGALGFAGVVEAAAGGAGDRNRRVNSPGGVSDAGTGAGVCGGAAGLAGGMVAGGDAGDWNERVNSPAGCDWLAAGGGGAFGFGGAAGDWNKRVNSPAGFSDAGKDV